MTGTEIAVVGSGPAGAVIALRLAELGHDVALLDAEEFPRSHIGEALTPGVADQLSFLGLSDVLAAALVGRTAEFELKWSSERFEAYTAMKAGFLVDRAAFDAGLSVAARKRGVHVLEATRVRAVERLGTGWLARCGGRTGPRALSAKFLVDATGRGGLLPKKRRRDYPLLVVHGRFGGSRLPACTRVTAAEHFWAWGAGTATGEYAAMVFLDPRNLKSAGDSLAERFRKLVSGCGLLYGAEPAELVGPVLACDASPYLEGDAIGTDFIKVGDAGLAIDPVSSAGVQAAIQSAMAGAVAVHTIRSQPERSRTVIGFWTRELARRQANHRAWTSEFYREAAFRFPTRFWQARAVTESEPAVPAPSRATLPQPNERVRVAASVSFRRAPCILGDTIEDRIVAAHPHLAEPVAFVGGSDLPQMLSRIQPGTTAADVLRSWSVILEPSRAMDLLSWTWSTGLLEPDEIR